MKSYPKAKPRRVRPKGVPAFLPVPMRPRADGWTPLRQARFLVALAATRSVLAAARKVGMARESAYRLRKAPGGASFAAAWDHVLGRPKEGRKCTVDELYRRAGDELLRAVVWQGELRALLPKPDNSALFTLCRQFDRTERWHAERGAKVTRFPPCSVSSKGAG